MAAGAALALTGSAGATGCTRAAARGAGGQVPGGVLPRKVCWIDLDDLGREYLDQQIAAGQARNLARAKLTGRTFTDFWAAPNCSVFRARAMTGLDAYRPGNGIGTIVRKTDTAWPGPSGQWIAEGLPGTSVKIGKVHLTGSDVFPQVMLDRGFDRFVGMRGNLGENGASYYNWLEYHADAQGTGVTTQTKHNTTRIGELALEEIALGTDLVHVSFNAIHAPLELPPNHEPPGKVYSAANDQEVLDAMLFHLDYWVGQLIAAAAPAGYVVIIACDNGTDGDGKGTWREDGVNTDLIVLGAGVASGASSRLVQATDLWATVRRLRGDPSGATALDSRDFTDELLAVPQVDAPREFLTVDWFPDLGAPPPLSKWSRCIRNAEWKLAWQKWTPLGTIALPYLGLHHLPTDPEEETNLLDAPLSPEAQAAYDLLLANLQS